MSLYTCDAPCICVEVITASLIADLYTMRAQSLTACVCIKAAQQLGRTSGYDPPRLLSLLHIAQWQSLNAAGGFATNYSMEAVAGAHLVLCSVGYECWSHCIAFPFKASL